jgi:hypothetical protein
MSLDVLWSPRDWAHAIAGLPAAGPVPSRCVLVPREAVAHALRRELLRADLGRALAGTRFVPTAAAAVEVLRAAGTDFRPGEDGLRPARLHALFRTGLRLRHFTPALLRDKPGWDAASSSTSPRPWRTSSVRSRRSAARACSGRPGPIFSSSTRWPARGTTACC